MVFDLLHLGDGLQAMHYFGLCFVAILGTLQGVAARFKRHDLLWFEPRIAYLVGGIAIVGSFIWFLITDQEIFIPGLAGGELFTIFAAAFVIAVPITRAVAWISVRLRVPVLAREKEPSA